MSFKIKFSKNLEEILRRLKRKDYALFLRIQKKIIQISNSDEVSIQHFKNLRGDLSNYKRVHIGHFVLLFRVEGNTIIFEDFRHHDKAYQR
ncbi:MAG: hypothetical protein DRP10_03585 [Candidatus Aenigmatarchaeota archaeon]|mgnify:CR=1 FL=1|nr:MAG: hypothetical protein DRP10_03585 [Candidatus Aenigmarchaeota archaeon]